MPEPARPPTSDRDPFRATPGVAIAAILSLCAIGITALVKGYNGTLMLMLVAAIAGIAGFTARDIIGIFARRAKPD